MLLHRDLNDAGKKCWNPEEELVPVDKRLQPAITDLVEHLIRGDFERLGIDGRIGRLTTTELEKAIKQYGCELITLPDDAFDIADSYPVEGESGKWIVDLPLWTEEEGMSDLTLTASVEERDGKVLVEIADLHVL